MNADLATQTPRHRDWSRRLVHQALRVSVTLWLAGVTVVATASAQEPATRAEALARERQEKAKEVEPPEPGALERALLKLENDRLFERLLSPPEGFYPKLGNLTPGSGIAFGPGYRKARLFSDELHLNAFAAANLSRYWMIEARLDAPELAGGRIFAGAYGRRYDFPEEDFFGLGPDSRREDFTLFDLHSTEVGGFGGVRPVRWLSLGGGLDYLTPEATLPAGLFAPLTLAIDQPDYLRTTLLAEVNTREPRGNPRQGAKYALTYQRYADQGDDRFAFDRVEADLQQYISLYRNRRILALRAFASMSDALDGAAVPFYMQRTLGGPDDLRGFRRFRFRDENVLLLQAEYRWEIFTAVDGAIFYDAGKVAGRVEDLNFQDLETDYGIGFRFGTRNGVFLRVEGAFGSSGGAHFIMRFGHVF